MSLSTPEASSRSDRSVASEAGALLAIDTSTEACSAALLLPGESQPRVREAQVSRAQAELILPMVEDLLTEAGLELAQLAAIAFARGPGSFTGVRLAASVTQGLAYGASLPVIPISTLAAVAAGVFVRDTEATHALVCNDARMGEVYWAIFDRQLHLGANGEAVTPPSAVTPSTVTPSTPVMPPAAVATPSPEARWALAGRGLAAYPEIIERWRASGVVTHVDDQRLPSARDVAVLARDALAAGRTVSAQEAIPVYVRDRVTHGVPPTSA
jgi:tRNA threonylcarbamoyladenosine biosynthesis protein TsaB